MREDYLSWAAIILTITGKKILKEFERDSPAHKIAKFQKERYKANKCEFCGFENRTGSAYCSTICATQAIEARMAYLKAIPEEPYKAPPQSE